MNRPNGDLPGAGDTIALLGKGSKFEGKLTFDGTVRIDGELEGEVFSEDTLVIGPGGQVQAELEVGTLVLQGHLIGNVRATALVDLRAPGRLEGNITAPNVMMERGVFFQGSCTMTPSEAGALAAAPARGQAPLPSPTLAPISKGRSHEE